MSIKSIANKIKFNLLKIWYSILRTWYKLVRFDWLTIILIIISIIIIAFVFKQTINNKNFVEKEALTNLLTINGIFSAVLITYLFTRITWQKERKLDIYRETVSMSQKITDYRRILHKLTEYYQVWENDDATKGLLDYSKYKNIDYYDYRLASISDYKPKDIQLIEELRKDERFIEGISNVYLAMISLVKNRHATEFYWEKELYFDFKSKGIYDIEVIEKWLRINIMSSIAYWFQRDALIINYYRLSEASRDYIIQTASRIDKKFRAYKLDNTLIKDLSNDIENIYLEDLYTNLIQLKEGVQRLSLQILLLISFSLFFGVLVPLMLLILDNQNWFYIAVRLVTAINAGLIFFFIAKFPFLINKELKWVK